MLFVYIATNISVLNFIYVVLCVCVFILVYTCRPSVHVFIVHTNTIIHMSRATAAKCLVDSVLAGVAFVKEKVRD